MIDLSFVREHPDLVKKNNAIRKCAVDVDEIIRLDQERRSLIGAVDEKRSELKLGSKTKPGPEQIASLKKLGDEIAAIEGKQKPIEEELNALLIQLPNLTDESVPEGKDDSGNVEITVWGEKPTFDFKPKAHEELGADMDLIDTERGAKVSGSRFWYLKNDLYFLEFAIVQYASYFMKQKGFIPMLPPMIVRERAMYGTGFFPADKNEIYKVNEDEDDLYLVGTAEVPLASYHADEELDFANGPKKYFGFSSCFRREAGTYGKDTNGILRGHQFDKIEMFVFADQETSWAMHEEMLAIAEEFWQSLGIPYHVLNMCSGDIGAPNAKKYDIEGWIPAQNAYRELASCSHDTDYQSRRLNIKYRDEAGALKLAHTLNNTVCALGRTIIAIMENYQQKDGSITVPQVLQPFMQGQASIQKKES